MLLSLPIRGTASMGRRPVRGLLSHDEVQVDLPEGCSALGCSAGLVYKGGRMKQETYGDGALLWLDAHVMLEQLLAQRCQNQRRSGGSCSVMLACPH